MFNSMSAFCIFIQYPRCGGLDYKYLLGRLGRLTQRGENMTELSTHDCAVAFLVKYSKPLHKVLKRALVFVLSDGLEHGQELFEVQQFMVHF